MGGREGGGATRGATHLEPVETVGHGDEGGLAGLGVGHVGAEDAVEIGRGKARVKKG